MDNISKLIQTQQYQELNNTIYYIR